MLGQDPTSRRLPFLPALDGIRAVAVVAVLLYHADLIWVPGGFLGVEVFFVLSGYLITSLLWAELRERGRISLTGFWIRRARRLLPAVFLLLACVTAAFVIGWPQEIARIRGDIAAALGYASNWYLIGTDSSYFSSLGRPSPFRHLWSLAIEEQFYLLWPPVLAFLALRIRRPARLAAVIVAGAAASSAAMWLLYSSADPSRAYYGTDSRAAGLLLGAALAIVWRPFAADGARRVSPRILDATVVASMGVLVWAFMRADEFAAFTYRPGIHLVALATAALIAASVHPHARVARALGWAPMRALGERSYAIYLWHWPVFVVTRPGVDFAATGWSVFGLRVVLTLLLAELSFRYVEVPIRGGALGRIAARLRARARRSPQALRRTAFGWSGIVTVSVLSLVMLTSSIVRAPAPAASSLELSLLSVEHALVVPMSTRPVADQARVEIPPRAVPTPRATVEKAQTRASPAPAPQAPVVSVPRVKADVVAVGDSVMLGARDALPRQIRNVYLDASVSRQVSDGLAVLRKLRDAGRLGTTVVVHLGNNGSFTAGQFDDMMRILKRVDKVIVVNVKAPRRWEASVNRTIAGGVNRHPSAVLVDWHTRWRACPDGVFYSDGIHLTPTGAKCYATLIAAAI